MQTYPELAPRLAAVAAGVPAPAVRDPLPDALRIVTHPRPQLTSIDANTRTSDQPLGEATVAVAFEGGPQGFTILGVDLDTGFVPVGYFSGDAVNGWYESILQELRDERAQAEDGWHESQRGAA